VPSSEAGSDTEGIDHYQTDGQDQGCRDVVNGVTNGQRTVIQDLDVDRGGQLGFKLRDGLTHCIDHGHGVGVRLAQNLQVDVTRPVHPAAALDVFDAVLHVGNF